MNTMNEHLPVKYEVLTREQVIRYGPHAEELILRHWSAPYMETRVCPLKLRVDGQHPLCLRVIRDNTPDGILHLCSALRHLERTK